MPIDCARFNDHLRRRHVVDERALGDFQLQVRRGAARCAAVSPSISLHQVRIGELPARYVHADDAWRGRTEFASASLPSAGTTPPASGGRCHESARSSSAMPMNSPGGTNPRAGWRQRTSASNAGDSTGLAATRSVGSAPRTRCASIALRRSVSSCRRDTARAAHRGIEDLARASCRRFSRGGARRPRRAGPRRAARSRWC